MPNNFFAADAYKLLANELALYRELRYEELVQLIGVSPPRRIRAEDFTEYSIQVTIRWCNREYGDILVLGWVAVDDCGPLHRLDDQFIVSAAAIHADQYVDENSPSDELGQ